MHIKKLSVQSFGKIKNRSFEFEPGLNIVFGNNESGKTTLLSFVRYMLFGFHGRRSESNLTQEEKFLPWDNTAINGSMDFVYDGNEYITSRTNGVRKECVTLNNTLGSKSFEGINPGEEIFGIDETAFMRTYCLSSSSGIFGAVKNDNILIRLSNLSSRGNEDVSYDKVNCAIMAEKKNTVKRLDDISIEIKDRKSLVEKQASAKERLKLLSSQLYEADSSIVSMRQSVNDKDRQNELFDNLNDTYKALRFSQIIKLLLLVLFVVLTIVFAVSDLFDITFVWLFSSFAVIDALLMIPARIRMLSIEKKLKTTQQDAYIYTGDTKEDIARTEEMRNNLLKEIGVIEAELDTGFSCEELNSDIQLLNEEKAELEKKIAVIDKAKYLLDLSYEELKNVFVPALNRRASEIFSHLMGYKYNDVIITDTFEILVKSEDRYRVSKYFSTATSELMYFSLRLALCEIIGEKESLPVFLDDCFASLDDDRVRIALEFLAEYTKNGRQIVFFTCHGREFKILSSLENVNVIMI